jgi:hypothetical protein
MIELLKPSNIDTFFLASNFKKIKDVIDDFMNSFQTM